MVHADSSADVCSKCSGPLSFQPRVNLDLDWNDSTARSPLSMREMIPLCNEDLDDYDAEIARLQSQITHVQTQRKRLIHYKTKLHFHLSPLRLFPNEVLSLIFESTCTTNLLQEYPWPYDAAEPRTQLSSPIITYLPTLAISAVCMRWRSLVVASPTLWSKISLETSASVPSGDYYDDDDEGFMSTIQLFLDRSVDTPLTISVETAGHNFNDPYALRLLLEHSHRWKSFAYSGDYNLRQLLCYRPSFTNLESLTIEYFQIVPSDDYTCFGAAPKLRSVITEGQISKLPLAWNHITSLDIRLPECEDLTVLRRYPALTVLKLRSRDGVFGPDITSLEKLESFTLVNSAYNATTLLPKSIFPRFKFSSLKELMIYSEFVKSKVFWPPSEFSAFVSRSTCMLTTLSLCDIEISDLDLIAALRILPSLVKLVIDGLMNSEGESTITDHFFSNMLGSSTPPLVPRLRSLRVETHETSFDDATYVDMVSSRWLPSSQAAIIGIDCLRSVVLYFSKRVVDEEVYKPLRQLNEMGMCVVITGKSK